MTSATTTRGALQQIVEQTRQLYSLPAVALQVLELTALPQVDCRELHACIENDPALTAKILRVVNSSLFGLSRPVGDLTQAVALLGIKPLTTLVLGFSLPKEMSRDVPAEVLGRYWRHTLVKAVACRELLEQVWHKPGDEAFIAGLLQDIGQLTLIQSLGDSYISFLDQVHAHGGGLLRLELDWLGFDHTVVSARQLEHWRLPKSLVAAVAVPPAMEQILVLPEAQRLLPQALHLGELFARLVEQPHGPALTSLLDVGGKYCRLTYEQVQAIFATLQKKVGELAAVFSLELPNEQTYVELLLTAHARLAELTEDSLVGDSGSAEQALLLQTLGLGALAQRASAPAGVNTIGPSPQPQETAPAIESGLASRVTAALLRCRQQRDPLSLVLVEIDEYAELLFRHGVDRVAQMTMRLRAGLKRIVPGRASLLQIADDRFAVLCEGCDRAAAATLVREIQADLKTWPAPHSSGTLRALPLSIGVATIALAPKNFLAADLISAAERCLTGARLSAGNAVKSIEF